MVLTVLKRSRTIRELTRNTSTVASPLPLAVELMQVVPSGLLVFFPSYAMMNKCVEVWKVSRATLMVVGGADQLDCTLDVVTPSVL